MPTTAKMSLPTNAGRIYAAIAPSTFTRQGTQPQATFRLLSATGTGNRDAEFRLVGLEDRYRYLLRGGNQGLPKPVEVESPHAFGRP